MNVINIRNLILSLEDIEYDENFEIIEHKDGSATLKIPDYILNDLEYCVEKGIPGHEDLVYSHDTYRFLMR